MLVVDQLRADLLDRYDTLFTGGLRRIRDEGLVFVNATHDHAITETSPGHATLSTGVYPSRHGVVGNLWTVRTNGTWQRVFNVVSADYPVLGVPTEPGASPDVLERGGLADWILAADTSSRVVSISAKDRAAVLLAGQTRSDVYWFDSGVGRFVTSTYYRDSYPSWVDEFNAEQVPHYAADTVWQSTVPTESASLARPDTAAFERDGVHTFFPHVYSAEAVADTGFFAWLATTPVLDAMTLDLARRAVEALSLGQDSVVDLLAVSLSQTDRVGHDFGPLSLEQLDNLLRLDRALGPFLSFLDESVGPGGWVMAFSSDHGSATEPEYLNEQGEVRARRLTLEDRAVLQQKLQDVAAGTNGVDPDELARRIVRAVKEVGFVANAWTHEELLRGQPADSFALLASRSLYPGRFTGLLGRFGVELQLEPNVLDWTWPFGTTHGSPYLYDRSVPLVFLGAGVTPGADDRRAPTTDVAPTLAALIGVPPPDDLDGHSLIPGRAEGAAR